MKTLLLLLSIGTTSQEPAEDKWVLEARSEHIRQLFKAHAAITSNRPPECWDRDQRELDRLTASLAVALPSFAKAYPNEPLGRFVRLGVRP